MTDHEREKQQLEEKLAEVEAANKELQQFAQVAAHDLKAPLRNIAGFVDLLQVRNAHQLDAKGLRFLEHIAVSVTQMQDLLDDLLIYARAGVGELEFEPVDLARITAGALGQLEDSIAEAGALIQCDALPTVLADRVQMGQLMLNLVGNAVKYRDDAPPQVKISAERVDDDWWMVTVEDNGIGVDPLYSDQIFETFKRLHSSAEYPGTGIGLSICRRIVARHGGKIWLVSREGTGSTFHLTLPALPGTAGQE